jgi:predicted RNA-binding protein with PUA-like domain
MSFWLLKTEPDHYSYADLERDGATVWDGVANNTALMHIRSMQPGDLALIYHTGDQRQAVGLAEITSAPYPDPQAGDPKLVVVDLKPLRQLPQPVTLTAVKADPAFADFALVRQGRLSVVPATEAQWALLLRMAGEA